MQTKVLGVESRLYIAVVPLLGMVYRQINIKKSGRSTVGFDCL